MFAIHSYKYVLNDQPINESSPYLPFKYSLEDKLPVKLSFSAHQNNVDLKENRYKNILFFNLNA
ncbi:MAG: hypothetical protein KAH18_06825 [Psychromonas sp.]|nr:hypothetical protein [Psychromonas sp.]